MASGRNTNKRKAAGTSGRNTAAKKTAAKAGSSAKKKKEEDAFIRDEIKVLLLFTVSVLLILSNIGIGGAAGSLVSGVMFGLFGMFAYVLPFGLFFIAAFSISNKRNTIAAVKAAAAVAAGFLFCAVCQMIWGGEGQDGSIAEFFYYSKEYRTGGGFFGGIICKGLTGAFGNIGAWIIIIVLIIICAVVITERSFIGGVQKGGKKVYDSASESAKYHRQLADEKREERKRARDERLPEEEKEKKSRVEKKVSGIDLEGTNLKKDVYTDEMRELTMETEAGEETGELGQELKNLDDMFEIEPSEDDDGFPEENTDIEENEESVGRSLDKGELPHEDGFDGNMTPKAGGSSRNKEVTRTSTEIKNTKAAGTTGTQKSRPSGGGYVFPPVELLESPKPGKNKDSDKALRETAEHLQQIFEDFGVNVTVCSVSRGPAVTRYEIQPEHGVKVSRIVALADDIKLNLAVPDVRIEAPIPGKAAVGIEVPNAVNEIVPLRELVTSDEFINHKSKLAFGVGKDIAGRIVVTDISKMPHLLIAGATGSGKSVCINTLIMSILYKAAPSEVKLIMIDPKVVELSVYNGIPHLMIPVVSDPKKAASALNWAVAEMTKRYKLFAEYNVRNLAGYNDKVKALPDTGVSEKPELLPQIVIIVDELADLMMVAPGEVEDAICRLAQLARAAGLHLVIATQRPSVNVITGLIKANMPSRIAFAVSSGVDSRTILDMNGAEKLLGKGDMLFYPYGYPKPVRVQGAFVSDEEVSAVVEFLKAGNSVSSYDSKIEEEISAAEQEAAHEQGKGADAGRDVLFADAGRFIIEKDKASIGMLQRWFKVGFNRAARIMDQLSQAGVVGEEAGTKPREILMTMEEFERFIEEQG